MSPNMADPKTKVLETVPGIMSAFNTCLLLLLL